MAKANLILTGWHHPEYLAAAAAVYGACHRGNAEVFGVSMGSLAAVLDAYGRRYRHIDVLGVGLTANLEKLARVLKELAADGVKVRWISRQAMPEDARLALDSAGAAFDDVTVADGGTLLDAVSAAFGVDSHALESLRNVAAASAEEPKGLIMRKGCSEPEVWAALYRAAGFAHRYSHDETACGDVVKALWNGVPILQHLPTRLDRLMKDYLSGCSRELVGESSAMVEARERLGQAARYADANVLILGETGTGKQLAAEYIHRRSDRALRNFIHHNCAYSGGGVDMLKDRLFGHEKGAFTGALSSSRGLFDDADGGTLFLDEIGEATLEVQSMLLTVLETGTFVRIGGSHENAVKVDVRLICATNRDLQQMVLDGAFRLDLYERISEFPVRLAPLREHAEDIPVLVRQYWRQMTGRMPTVEQLRALADYDYPGNVRELVSLLKQAYTLCPTKSGAPVPEAADFKAILDHHKSFNGRLIAGLASRRASSAETMPWPDRKEDMLVLHVARIYGKYGRNISAAAAAADIATNTFKKYLAKAKSKGLA